VKAIRLETVGGLSREDMSRTRKEDITGANDREPSQKIKQAKMALSKLYQENMELRRQLVTKTMETSAMQGREGNVAWLKSLLKEAQDMISYEKHKDWRKKYIWSIPEKVKRPRRKPTWLSPVHRKRNFSKCSFLHLKNIRQILAILKDVFPQRTIPF
jgi:hypothetical protein